MSSKLPATEFHPRWYRQRVSTYWWLKRGSYLAFVLREVSSAFVAWFVVFLLLLIHAVGQGADRYEQFRPWARQPAVLVLNLVSLLFIVYHAVTWFNLAPQAMVVRLGGKRVPGALIAGSNYALWALATALTAWFILGG